LGTDARAVRRRCRAPLRERSRRPVRRPCEIRRGYLEQPPDDRIQLLGIQDDVQDDRVTAAFVWERGGTGRLVLEHDRGAITRLVVIFDQ
jgi:hypothetical protein